MTNGEAGETLARGSRALVISSPNALDRAARGFGARPASLLEGIRLAAAASKALGGLDGELST
jgi:hypothetical protein